MAARTRLVCERARCHSPAKLVTLLETFLRGGDRPGLVTLRITRQLCADHWTAVVS